MKRILYLSVVLLGGVAVSSTAQGRDKVQASSDPAGVGRVSPGLYVEVDDKGVSNPLLVVRVQEVTTNIVEIRGANGWVTYASYYVAQKEYRGFFEWQQFGDYRNPGGKWADLYQVRLVAQEGGQFHMTGKSKANDFVIRGKPKP
jgi:hypothetical protein